MTITSIAISSMVSVPIWTVALATMLVIILIALFLVVLCAKGQIGEDAIRSKAECPLVTLNETQAPWQISEESLRDANRQMAEDYVKLQNEYAWYRNLVKHEHPEAHAHAEIQIRKAKEEARLTREAKGVDNG